jgi:hypothetical protein
MNGLSGCVIGDQVTVVGRITSFSADGAIVSVKHEHAQVIEKSQVVGSLVVLADGHYNIVQSFLRHSCNAVLRVVARNNCFYDLAKADGQVFTSTANVFRYRAATKEETEKFLEEENRFKAEQAALLAAKEKKAVLDNPFAALSSVDDCIDAIAKCQKRALELRKEETKK